MPPPITGFKWLDLRILQREVSHVAVAARNDATNERLESLTGFALYPSSSVLVCPLYSSSERQRGHERTGNMYIIRNVVLCIHHHHHQGTALRYIIRVCSICVAVCPSFSWSTYAFSSGQNVLLHYPRAVCIVSSS